MNIWTKLGIGAAIATATGFLLKFKRTTAELESIVTAKVHQLDLSGLTIRLDIQLKNPTKGSFSIKFPFVKLIYKNVVLGSSQVINKDILIPSFGEAGIEAVMVKIPFFSMFSVVSELSKALKSGSEIKISVKTITTIDLGFKTIPYEKTEEIILKK